MRIGLIAHDKNKTILSDFISDNQNFFKGHQLFSTHFTAQSILKKTKLDILEVRPAVLGGNQQIGSLVSSLSLDFLIFLVDPLTPSPHSTDTSALIRICNVHNIPLALNLATSQLLIKSLERNI